MQDRSTDFEFLPIDVSFTRCERYYYKLKPASGNLFGTGFNNNTTKGRFFISFPTQMRTVPYALEQTGTAANYSILNDGDNVVTCSSVPTLAAFQTSGGLVDFTVASGLTSGEGSMGRSSNADAYLAWTAEL